MDNDVPEKEPREGMMSPRRSPEKESLLALRGPACSSP